MTRTVAGRVLASVTRALALATSILVAACGKGDPGGPNAAATPQTLFTYQNAVAYLPPGIAEYKEAIVFLPGLRDPATGNPLDSRALVRGTSGGTCSIWCLTSQRAEVRSRALELAGGNVALIGTTLLDDAAGYATLLIRPQVPAPSGRLARPASLREVPRARTFSS
jgi:hypothetical protein